MRKNLVCVASHTITFCKASGSWLHIPDGFWVVWEGPPYRPHSLGDGSKCRRGKGLKTVCIAPTHTSANETAMDVYAKFASLLHGFAKQCEMKKGKKCKTT